MSDPVLSTIMRVSNMRLEALAAIIIGVVMGLGITYGFYTIRSKALDSSQNTEVTPTPTPTPPPVSEKLLITAPQDEAVLASNELRISGTAEANEMVVILVNDDEFITQADDIGAFAQDVELKSGGNIITITAIAADGVQTSQTLHVAVSTADLTNTGNAESTTDEATAEAKAGTKTPTPTKKASPTPTKKAE